ncbi:Zn(II)2Cys6 transcription factor domain-containing protein [Aspergillus affinis]|uniref:Zn(II)2Cys6 transcription factor domain-containing protein n=1 Tax=Aspergillus affinis TaxID=1070780 RepID=UPI0022FE2D28|nr:uncharacterized protein KD926_010101 [Aspergillus affinis]KAI9038999.1 hypothetical protein KD926_010101 [Aspergillus affinis]
MPRQNSKPVVSRDSPYDKDYLRSRVPKACDRCRRKKTKCDGSSPCQRCRAENANCVFGDRKRVREKVYPEGYTTFLEEQRGWLIHGIRELYRHVQAGDGWPGEPLKCDANGQLLVHDILSQLGSLDQAGASTTEESKQPSQQKLQIPQDRNLQRPQSSTGSSHSLTLAQASPMTPTYLFSSPRMPQARNTAFIHDSLSLPTQPIADTRTLQSAFDIHPTNDVDQSGKLDMIDPANHVGLLYNDVQAGFPSLQYPTDGDSMSSDLFPGIGYDIDDWEMFFQSISKNPVVDRGLFDTIL